MNASSLFLGVTATTLLAGSCSYLVDTSVTQCNTSADCTALAGPGTRMVCSADKICVKGPDCTSNAECQNANGGRPSMCRKSDQKCVALTSAECVLKAEDADLLSDNTLWFGLLGPRMSGAHMEAAADLVRQQIRKSGNLPAATINGPRRTLAFVSCTNDNASLAKSMNHLLGLGLPAIVGSNTSGDVISMLSDYTTKAGVLTLSPTAAAPNISDIQNGGLFFRMSGTDTIAVKTLSHVLKTVVEPQLRSGSPPVVGMGEQLKVSVMYKGDALGISNANAASSMVMFNGKSTAQNGSNYKAIDYGDQADPGFMPSRYASAVADVIAFRPHVIFVFGSLEFSNMAKELEAQWPPNAPYRPYYLVVKGLVTVFVNDVGTNESWARRILGAQPYVDKSTAAYRAFEQAFRDNYPHLTAGATATATPSYFDGAYVLAYAVAANGNQPVTGANLATAIRTRLTPPGRKISVGYDRIFEVFSTLAGGERVDLEGLTGSLDFFANGDVPQTQEVFCMKTEPAPGGGFGKVVAVKAAGMIFDPTTDTVSGTIKDCPGP
jgi:ABC-type branched-subunit amino acid transport system substrate-binding protein